MRLQDYQAPVPETVRGAMVLHVPELRALLEQHAALPIDVLPAPRRPAGMRPDALWLPVPHQDLPGSLWWPGMGRGALPADVEARFAARLRALAAAHPGQRIVFYCRPNCWLSWNAARRAAGYGVPVGWFPEGADGWHDAGLPLQDAMPEFVD